MSSPVTDELNRLTARGLDFVAAMHVMSGQCDEEFEVARRIEERAAEEWRSSSGYPPSGLTPLWDLDPSRFYLVGDGALPEEFDPDEHVLIRAECSDVAQLLTCQSGRAEGPWEEGYACKSSGIAYRWLNGLAVTPPMLRPLGSKVAIAGGMHRFHLAKHYGDSKMPFLVERCDLEALKQILRCSEWHGAR